MSRWSKSTHSPIGAAIDAHGDLSLSYLVCSWLVVTLVLAFLACSIVPTAAADTQLQPLVGSDDHGNIHITPTFNGSVFIGNLDLMDMLRRVSILWDNGCSCTSERLYVVGGNSDDTNNLASMYTFSGTAWSSAPEMPTARRTVSAAAFRGKLYVTGGHVSSALDVVEVFDGESWTTLSQTMLSPRQEHGSVVFNDRLYVIGGYDEGPLASVEYFDGDSWSSAPSMPTAREELVAVVYQGHIYAIGGEQNGAYIDTVEKFDGSNWSSAPSLRVKRGNMPAAAVYNNRIYVAGGRTDGAAYTNTVESFDGTSWSEAPALQTARRGAAAAAFMGRLYVIGGRADDFLDVVETFDGNAWSSAPPMPTPRTSAGVAVLRDTDSNQ